MFITIIIQNINRNYNSNLHKCSFFQLNADIYENDPELQKIREERGYSYMDIITIHPDKLPDYENKVGYAYLHDSYEMRIIFSIC